MRNFPIFGVWIVVTLWLMYGLRPDRKREDKVGKKIMFTTTAVAAWASWKFDPEHEFLTLTLMLAVAFALMISYRVWWDKDFRPWRARSHEEKLKTALAQAEAARNSAASDLDEAVAEINRAKAALDRFYQQGGGRGDTTRR